jgi:hypothetical protein
VLKYHLFESEGIEEITIGPESQADVANLRFPKRESVEDREECLERLLPTQLNPPGLKEIKQVELYAKFREFLNPANWEKTCPYPEDEVMNRIKYGTVPCGTVQYCTVQYSISGCMMVNFSSQRRLCWVPKRFHNCS